MKGNKLKKAVIILAIILVSLVSFTGVYVQEQNRMENKVKDYTYGMNLKGVRVVTLKVSDEKETVIKDKEGNVIENITDDEIKEKGYVKEEVAINKEEILSEENYNKTKNILEQRLKKLAVSNYNIRLNTQDGTIILELPENDTTDFIVSNLTEVGKFEITDSEDTNNVFINKEHVKTANVLYSATETGTAVYLDIILNKEGTKKLEEVTKQYVTIEDTTSEETTTEESTDVDTSTENTTQESETVSSEEVAENTTEEQTQKTIALSIDGNPLITTSFDEPITDGRIRMTMGQASTDMSELQTNIQSATAITTLLVTEQLPIEYTTDGNEFISSNITKDDIIKIAGVLVIALAIALIILVFKYKGLGLLSVISFVGLIAIYLLIIRYTNVIITLEGLCGIIIIILLNYIFNNNMLKLIKKSEDEKIAIKESFIDFMLKIIPVSIASIVFCFIQWESLNSFGMIMFWGIVTILIYNYVITKTLLNKKTKN